MLPVDRFGNRTAPRHQRLLAFDLSGPPTVDGAARLENALRALERRFPAGPAGLLLTVGWGPHWFETLGRPSPVPRPTAMSVDEAPELDAYACCMHLASDDERIVAAADHALAGRLDGVLRLAERRTGFHGAGLPHRAARGLVGIPAGRPARDAPLLMGFRSGTRRNQAREDDVTIADGPWAGSTTMHVSLIGLALGSWYRSLDDDQRVHRMFAPQVSAAQVADPRAGIDPPSASVAETARRHGVVGHLQTTAAARRNGRPRILRRDFSSVDGDEPLVQFVSLQRSIDDFVATRTAMNAAKASAADQRVAPQVNNGINEWLSVRRRANYLVPPRSRRSFPGLDGWDAT